MDQVAINFSLSDIQTLNNIISNSTPTLPFGTINKLVQGINVQLQAELNKLKETAETEPEQEPPVEDFPDTKVD